MSDIAIRIENLKKEYKLGAIGGGTLSADIESWWAKKRGREDPNVKIGVDQGKFGKTFYALNGINLEIKKGEAVGIIGTNGAGKSTLLKVLSRVTAPTEGKFGINGRIASMLEVGTGFHPELTGRENIYMNGAILGMTKREIDEKIEEIIDFSECRDFIDTPVKRYSSGMHVKLGFAVAAHLDAEIMIMDEVLAVGDVKFQKKCLGKMGDAAQHDGKTVLYVSHNMSTVRRLCTRCIVLDHGRVIFDGDVEEAINIYSDVEKGELQSYYDFDEIPRPSLDHGKNFFIHSFEFLDREVPIFYNDEKVIWKMVCSSLEKREELGIYYTLCWEDSTIIGTYQCNACPTIEANHKMSMTIEMDISNIVEGTYYFYLDVFYMNEYNTYKSVDHPLKRVYFSVKDKANICSIPWQRRYYGSIRLPELKIVDYEILENSEIN